jgi:thioredoxin reductase (NADPH)
MLIMRRFWTRQYESSRKFVPRARKYASRTKFDSERESVRRLCYNSIVRISQFREDVIFRCFIESKEFALMGKQEIYDCLIIGAGPGGLQAAIYLGRFNRDVILIDRSGGRTYHARAIENFLSQRVIPGKEIIANGTEQAAGFGARIEKGRVTKVLKNEHFVVGTEKDEFHARFVIVSSGGYDNLPPVENIFKFLGAGFFTCVDCDGYKTTGRKLVIIGNSQNAVRLALGMKEMFTRDITLILYFYDPPDDYKELLREEEIMLVKGRPGKIIGGKTIEALELQDGRKIGCEVIMSDFGFKLNDDFLSELPLRKDSRDFKYIVNHNFESSLDGLYIVGPLNTGHDQAIIAAGEGAVAAIEINKRLLNL